MPFIPHTPDEVQEMLSVVGVRNLDDLFADIPPEMRPKHFDLPKGQSEFAVCRYFEDLAAANVSPSVSFLGAGFYAHYVPRAVDALSGRSEFYTSYTPLPLATAAVSRANTSDICRESYAMAIPFCAVAGSFFSR